MHDERTRQTKVRTRRKDCEHTAAEAGIGGRKKEGKTENSFFAF